MPKNAPPRPTGAAPPPTEAPPFSWLQLLGHPVRLEEAPPPSHPLERLHLEVRPFIYFDGDEGYICEGGEIVLEGLDLTTERDTGRVHLKARARATLRLLGEKEPRP